MLNVEEREGLLLALASLKQDMSDIKQRLDEKKAYLSTEEAVDSFSAYLKENTRPNTGRGFDFFLEALLKTFSDRNMCVIPAVELQEFIAKYWGKKHRGTLRQETLSAQLVLLLVYQVRPDEGATKPS